jgi:hypothetical protein
MGVMIWGRIAATDVTELSFQALPTLSAFVTLTLALIRQPILRSLQSVA